MKKIIIILIIAIQICSSTHAQVYLNPGVDTTQVEVGIAYRFYSKYLSSFKGEKLPDMSQYWTESELMMRSIPDQLVFALNSSPLYNQDYSPTIIYMRSSTDYVHIKTQFSAQLKPGNIMTMAITNHFIGFDKNRKPFLINPMTLKLKNDWKVKIVRNISFYYQANHRFNAKRADSLINSIIDLEKVWNLKPIKIKYYFTQDYDQIYKLKGFDYALTMGNRIKVTGISDDVDNQVFSAGYGENHFHEIVHIYLNRLCVGSPIREGLATFYGGSMGQNIKWHLRRVNRYLLNNPNTDLTNLGDFWYSDPFTNPNSVIQGLICQLVFERDGINGLRRVIMYKSFKDIFEKEFKIKETEINSFLRKKISEEVK